MKNIKHIFTSLLLICAIFLSTLPITSVSAEEPMRYHCGDVNGDRQITITDVLQILMTLAKISTSEPNTKAEARRAALVVTAAGSAGNRADWIDDAAVRSRSLGIGDALQTLMVLAKIRTGSIWSCYIGANNINNGCSWCIKPNVDTQCPYCKNDPCVPCNDCDGGICSAVCIHAYDFLPQAPDVTPNFRNLTATQLVGEIKTGWNLGNTFDSHDDSAYSLDLEYGNAGYAVRNSTSVNSLEVRWLNGSAVNRTERSLIQALKEHGFDTIRIPVTWYKVADPNDDWTIRSDFIGRVKEVVCWAMREDMYVILNTHHEEGALPIFNPQTGSTMSWEERQEQSELVIERLWQQIAEEFNSTCGDCGTARVGNNCGSVEFNERLIFEGLNEPRNVRLPRNEQFNGGTVAERAGLNVLNQLFVNTVRAAGGNNAYRILMIPTHGASANNASFNGFVIPTDTVANTTDGVSHKISLSIHSYTPNNFCYSGSAGSYKEFEATSAYTNQITNALNLVKTNADNLGVPVILGEWGSTNKNNTADRAVHAEFYVNYARERGMKCVLWDNFTLSSLVTTGENFGMITRASQGNVTMSAKEQHPARSTPAGGDFQPIIDAIMRGAGAKFPKVPAPLGPAQD